MYTASIDPIIFESGALRITYYALVYIFGVIGITYYLLRNRGKVGISSEKIYGLVLWLLVGMMLGARLFSVVFWGWEYYSADITRVLRFWEGGFAFHGGLFGGLIGVYLYCKKRKIEFLKVLDILVFPVLFFLALGRLANFINQEIVGIVTTVPWCFNFKGYLGCRHPVVLYAFLGRSILLVGLIFVRDHLKKFNAGLLFWLFIFFIGVGRFTLDFLREDILYYGLRSGQWLSLIMILVGGYVLMKKYARDFCIC